MGIRDAIGYLIGFILFIILIPAFMWLASGHVAFGNHLNPTKEVTVYNI